MSTFSVLGTIEPQRVWEGVIGRTINGERVTLSYVELDPGVEIPEHSHENEQLGVILRGSMTFTVDGETKKVGPGEAWCITGHVPHSASVGPEGAVVVEVFSPVRSDWAGLETEAAHPPLWP